MSIDEYIESLTNFNKDSEINKVKLPTAWLPSINLSDLPQTEILTRHSEFENSSYNETHKSVLKSSIGNKLKTSYGQANLWRNSSIKSTTKQQYTEVALEYSSNESYITVSSGTESSYFTAIEDFTCFKKTSYNLESEISFDSGIDEGKRDLITRLLQSKGEDFLNKEEFLSDCPTNDSQDLLHDIEIEQKYWNENVSDQLMYKDRISRFFQTTDSPVVAIQKEAPVNANSRQYFMNLSDEHFSEFQIRKSSNNMSLREDQLPN